MDREPLDVHFLRLSGCPTLQSEEAYQPLSKEVLFPLSSSTLSERLDLGLHIIVVVESHGAADAAPRHGSQFVGKIEISKDNALEPDGIGLVLNRLSLPESTVDLA
jgi:hypothetical protein